MYDETNDFGFGIEVILSKPDDFLKIKETLTRIGIMSKKENILFQSVHILHKRGRYFLIHFKELFLLANKQADFSDDDFRRRNTIAKLVSEWGLCKLVDKSTNNLIIPISEIGILPHKEKKNWRLESKFTVGNKRN